MVMNTEISKINIRDYNYDLPDDRIAQYPLETRDSSKLLIFKSGSLGQDIFINLANHIPDNSLIIFNETRVIHARLLFTKTSGTGIEIFCLEPLAPFRDHQRALQQRESCEWKCLVGNSKRWKSGKLYLGPDHEPGNFQLVAERMSLSDEGTSTIRFSWTPANLTFAEILETAGRVPLPPYIHRNPVAGDNVTYQTVYAKKDGSVAAPTAGLHFSEEVFASLAAKKTDVLKFTLHVGAGTFKPVTAETIDGHAMHAEQVHMPLESLEKLRNSLQRPVIAVGTTTTRMLESLYWHGVRVIHGVSAAGMMSIGQWDPYNPAFDLKISREDALDAVISGLNKSGEMILQGSTSLMIVPGYHFRYPDILITNFHQPKSTLLLLIAAFIGKDWKEAYRYALDHDFRFLSYGDSCLFFNHEIK